MGEVNYEKKEADKTSPTPTTQHTQDWGAHRCPISGLDLRSALGGTWCLPEALPTSAIGL